MAIAAAKKRRGNRFIEPSVKGLFRQWRGEEERKNPDQALPVSMTIRANASGAVPCSHVVGTDHSAHSEPDRAGSGANKTSEDDPNLLYDGVADTLVSLLLRNAQHLQAKASRFRIDLLLRRRLGPDQYQRAMDVRSDRRPMCSDRGAEVERSE
jgi:hypothetical protein